MATGEIQKRKLTRDPDAPARAAAYKRRAPSGRARGDGECIDAARKEIGSRTVECPRCGLLVDWRQAKSAATRARRELRPGDGCKGQQCGKRRRVRAPERARAQVKMADGLLSAAKTLVAWPAGSEDWHVWERPTSVAHAIARKIKEMFGA